MVTTIAGVHACAVSINGERLFAATIASLAGLLTQPWMNVVRVTAHSDRCCNAVAGVLLSRVRRRRRRRAGVHAANMTSCVSIGLPDTMVISHAVTTHRCRREARGYA